MVHKIQVLANLTNLHSVAISHPAILSRLPAIRESRQWPGRDGGARVRAVIERRTSERRQGPSGAWYHARDKWDYADESEYWSPTQRWVCAAGTVQEIREDFGFVKRAKMKEAHCKWKAQRERGRGASTVRGR